MKVVSNKVNSTKLIVQKLFVKN